MSRRHTATLVVSLLLALAALTVRAQPYSIDWFSIDGGGGTSAGGKYAVTGSIGQPDTGAMRGGNFTLEGGFWSVIGVIPTPGAPDLSVGTFEGTLRVIWTFPAEGWLLDVTPVLTQESIPWAQVPSSQYQTNAAKTHIYINIAPASGTRFYRLRKLTL